MNVATATHYSQPLQPPTATINERVTCPLLLLLLPPPPTTTSDDYQDGKDNDIIDNNKAVNTPDNLPLVDARYSPR